MWIPSQYVLKLCTNCTQDMNHTLKEHVVNTFIHLKKEKRKKRRVSVLYPNHTKTKLYFYNDPK
jgi:ribosomal protein L44E